MEGVKRFEVVVVVVVLGAAGMKKLWMVVEVLDFHCLSVGSVRCLHPRR